MLIFIYIAYEPSPPPPPAVRCPSGGAVRSCPASPSTNVRPVTARDHLPNRASPVSVLGIPRTPRLPLTRQFQIPTPPPLPRPFHAFRIPVTATPLLSPKYLPMWPSAVFQIPPAATTAPGASPLPRNPSPLGIPRKEVINPPTLLLLPAAYQCRSGVVASLLPEALLPTPPSAKIPSAFSPSSSSPDVGTPHALPQVSLSLQPTAPRSPPQIATLLVPLRDRNFTRRTDLPPPSVATYLYYPTLVAPSWCP